MKTGAKQTGENWRDFYQTPQYILDAVNAFFPYGYFDPCPPNPAFDGLSIKWPDAVYLNPPFSTYKDWAEKGRREANGEQLWIFNQRHSTEWQRSLLHRASTFCLLHERVRFVDPRTGKQTDSTYPAASQTIAYVSYGEKRRLEFYRAFKGLGLICEGLN